jgi:hypothetical protein
LSFTDDYTPQYTSAEGTAYEGNYWPLVLSNYWEYSGSACARGVMSESGSYDTTISIDDSCYMIAYMYVFRETTMTVDTGTYPVFPFDELITIQNLDGPLLRRYMQNKDDMVYIRAYDMKNEGIVPAVNQVFIRSPLVVGESWKSEPKIDIHQVITHANQIMSRAGVEVPDSQTAADIQMEVTCRMFVIGTEPGFFRGQEVETIRLDQRTEAFVTIEFDSSTSVSALGKQSAFSGALQYTIQDLTILNVCKDAGLIRQRDTMTVAMQGSLRIEGDIVTRQMSLSIDRGVYSRRYRILESDNP